MVDWVSVDKILPEEQIKVLVQDEVGEMAIGSRWMLKCGDIIWYPETDAIEVPRYEYGCTRVNDWESIEPSRRFTFPIKYWASIEKASIE
jgi:hypothetical protein